MNITNLAAEFPGCIIFEIQKTIFFSLILPPELKDRSDQLKWLLALPLKFLKLGWHIVYEDAKWDDSEGERIVFPIYRDFYDEVYEPCCVSCKEPLKPHGAVLIKDSDPEKFICVWCLAKREDS